MPAKGIPVRRGNIPYDPLPPNQSVVVLTFYRPSYYGFLRRLCLGISALLLISAALFFLYPSDPDLQLARISLNRVQVNASPKLTLDLSFSLTVRVRNRDFFSLDYDSLLVSVGYRGGRLGWVRSHGGHVRARGSSYVNATLDLDGLEIIQDAIYLISDLANGVIPFDADTRVKGDLGLFFFKIPIQGRVSCEVYVNTNSQKIVRQDCHPQ